MNYFWMVCLGLTAFAIGRNALVWSILGFIFGGWTFIPLILRGPNLTKVQERTNGILELSQFIESKKQPKEYQDFNTVDDLFKQLQNK